MFNNQMPNMTMPYGMAPPNIPNGMPFNNVNDQMQMPNMNAGMPFNNMAPMMENNDITTRLNAIERQIRRLEQRIAKLEILNNSGQNIASNTTNNIQNEPDNSMYMM